MQKQHYIALFSALLMTACTSHWDLQGHDPRDYYAKHPIANKVETRYVSQLVHFEPAAVRLDMEEAKAMRKQMAQVSPMAAESVEIQVHSSQLLNSAREEYLMKTLAALGFSKKIMTTVSSEEVRPHDVNIQVAYAAVVPPRCPDWRMSPVTAYSNMTYSANISCATTTNIGLMVADPRDLVEGEGDNTPDTHNTTTAIQQYRGGAAAAATGAGEASSGEAATTGQ